MGLFGDMDASEVSDNPFYVAPDTYTSVLTEISIVTSKKNPDNKGMSLQFAIDESDSEYNGNSIAEWINVHLDLDSDAVTTQIRRDLARLKGRLTDLGMSLDEMNDLVDAEGNLNEDVAKNYIGNMYDVTVVEVADKNDPNKKYTNIKTVSAVGE